MGVQNITLGVFHADAAFKHSRIKISTPALIQGSNAPDELEELDELEDDELEDELDEELEDELLDDELLARPELLDALELLRPDEELDEELDELELDEAPLHRARCRRLKPVRPGVQHLKQVFGS